MSKKGQWKEEAFRDQMSQDRDFPVETQVNFKYAICCGHRTGSNLLGEALYGSGLAGDPMEYFNQRFLKFYASKQGGKLNYKTYLEEMRRRRTSPNGVFGINVKFDQLRSCFGENWNFARQLIINNDYIVYLYRRDKLRQAISTYIGQQRDVFNIPSDVSDEEVAKLVNSVTFDPRAIAGTLQGLLRIDQSWLNMFKNNELEYETLAYEDFTSDYEGSVARVLEKCGVPAGKHVIPEQPLKKIANSKNEEFRERFLDLVQGKVDFAEDAALLEEVLAT